MKRTSHEIKKKILKILSEVKTCTYSELERKVNTGYRSIVANCKELASFNAIRITQHDRHDTNGRPYFELEVTKQGREFLKNL